MAVEAVRQEAVDDFNQPESKVSFPDMSVLPPSVSAPDAERESEYQTVGDYTAKDPVMTVRDCNVFYGDKQALIDVNLDIGRNEVVALIVGGGASE